MGRRKSLRFEHKKKIEKLQALFRENDYDSEDEEYTSSLASRAAPLRQPPAAAIRKVSAPTDGQPQTSPELRQRLQQFVDAVDKKANLVQVDLANDNLPAELLLDLNRAVTRHQEAKERKQRAKDERGARTAHDALKDQMEELKADLEGLSDTKIEDIASILAGDSANS